MRLFAETPCFISCFSLVLIEGLWWFINVWDCQAELLAQDAADNFYDVQFLEPELEEEIQEDILQNIDEQGGAINFSGYYSISDSLAQKLEKALIEEKIKLVREAKEVK
jgi:hypothetical protein